VNVIKGCFYDHNPTADPASGGALTLFAELCGYSGCEESETLGEMVKWAEGKPPPAPKEKKPGPLEKLDALEEKWMESERREEAGITLLKTNPAFYADLDRDEILRDYESRLAETRAALVNIRARQEAARAEERAEVKERRKTARIEARRLEKAGAETWTREWIELAEISISRKEDYAAHLAAYRGLSPEVFRWLIEAGYLVLDADCQIAFPIVKRDRVVGMHVKWRDEGNGSSGWYCVPKGVKLSPLIIGDLEGADLVVIAESTWDAVAYIDLYALYREEGWAAVVTRGAGNSSKVPAKLIEPGASVSILLQSDEAGGEWFRWLPFAVRRRGYPIFPPPGIKDFNDWMRAVPRAEILQQLNN
jgi:hypothetical protein